MNRGHYRQRILRANPTAVLLLLVFFLSPECFLLAQEIIDSQNFPNTQISTNSTHNGPATGLVSGPAGKYCFGFTSATNIYATLENGTSLANGGWVFSGNLAFDASAPIA